MNGAIGGTAGSGGCKASMFGPTGEREVSLARSFSTLKSRPARNETWLGFDFMSIKRTELRSQLIASWDSIRFIFSFCKSCSSESGLGRNEPAHALEKWRVDKRLDAGVADQVVGQFQGGQAGEIG